MALQDSSADTTSVSVSSRVARPTLSELDNRGATILIRGPAAPLAITFSTLTRGCVGRNARRTEVDKLQRLDRGTGPNGRGESRDLPPVRRPGDRAAGRNPGRTHTGGQHTRNRLRAVHVPATRAASGSSCVPAAYPHRDRDKQRCVRVSLDSHIRTMLSMSSSFFRVGG